MTHAEAETVCRAIYHEARAFLSQIKRIPDYGYKLLNSPPIHRAQVLFIGYQPGGGAKDAEVEASMLTHERWPDVSEYATANWALASNMRRMFEPDLDFHECVGLNAIFLRYPTMAAYTRGIDRQTRHAVRDFCTSCVVRIADALAPQKIVAIGLGTLKLFGPTSVDMRNEAGRVLTTAGRVGRRNALALIHLSGARLSNEDRALIRDRVLSGS
jgi:hypothetical protein